MKKLDFNIDPFADIRKLCPECIFTPKYPYVFKFDLILQGVNYGEIEVKVNLGLELSELKGDKRALAIIDKKAKEKKDDYFYQLGLPIIFMSYPLTKIDQLYRLLEEEGLEINKGCSEMLKLIAKTYTPINAELLYEKTGIEINY